MTGPDYDVVVAGGGPAGATAAFVLAGRGHRVLLAESSRYTAPRLGDALAPSATALLGRLGLGPAARECAIPSTGIRSAWGGPEAYSHSFLFDPHGEGVHVDRQRFDRNLAHAAADAGADLADARVTHCAHTAGGWQHALPHRQSPVTARAVIDATGRAAALGRACGARRVTHDRLIGIATEYRGRPVERGEVLVEAARDGWWYAGPVPPDRLIVMFLTDADICRTRRYTDAATWQARLHETRHVHALTTGHIALRGPHTRSAAGGHLTHDHLTHDHLTHGQAPAPWLAVGDAALARDPLSGNGIENALGSGHAGANAISAWLTGDPDQAREYHRGLAADVTEYLHQRTTHYRSEQRWPESVFWQRRHR